MRARNRRRKPNRKQLARRPRGLPPTPNDAVTQVLKCDPMLLVVAAGSSVFTGTGTFSFDATSDFTTVSTTRLNTFSEFRIVKLTAKITPLQNGAAGSSAFAFVPQNGLTSTGTLDQYPGSIIVPNSAVSAEPYVLHWYAKTTSELNFNDTPAGPTVVPVVFGAVTDLTNFGTTNAGGVNLTYFRVDFYATTQMRGLYVS
jgi:hypothetical protein